MKIRIALLSLIALIFGCASSMLTPEEAERALFAHSTWNLVELQGKPVTTPEGRTSPSLSFTREGSRASGYGGCNRFTGTFTLEQVSRLRFSPLAATRMACAGDTVESEFLHILETVDSYHVEGETLVLIRAGSTPLARLQPAQ